MITRSDDLTRHVRSPPCPRSTTRPPPPHLRRAAALRARGLSWEAAAGRVGLDPGDLERQAADAGPAYRALYRRARRDVTDEACAEAPCALRRELRSDDDKARRQAAEGILKLRMAEMRHAKKAGPKPDPVAAKLDRMLLARAEERLKDRYGGGTDDDLGDGAGPAPPPRGRGSQPRAGRR